MSDAPPTPPPSRPVLSVLGVLVLVAAVVAGAVLKAQRVSDRTASPTNAEVSESADDASRAEAPTPGGADLPTDLGELPTIDPSDFPTETGPPPLPTEFPTDIFPSEFPTDDAGWQEWAESQMEDFTP